MVKLIPVPAGRDAFHFQVRLPAALASKVRHFASLYGCSLADAIHTATVTHLPVIAAYPEGAAAPSLSDSVRVVAKLPMDVMQAVNAQVRRMCRWNLARTELVPGGSRDAVIALCVGAVFGPDVVLDYVDSTGRKRAPTTQALIPVPPQLHDWLHARNPRGVSTFVRQALETQLPQIEADPSIKRGSAAQPRGAKWPTLSVRVQSRAWDEAERIAVVKHMPRVQVLRAAVVRAVIEAARQEEALRRAERERQEIISRGVFATQP